MHIHQYLHVFGFCTIYRTVHNSYYMYMYMYCVQLQCMHTMTIIKIHI